MYEVRNAKWQQLISNIYEVKKCDMCNVYSVYSIQLTNTRISISKRKTKTVHHNNVNNGNVVTDHDRIKLADKHSFNRIE